jgi:hypothetical protein
MQMPLVMLHGSYGTERLVHRGRIAGTYGADIPLDYDVPTYPATGTTSSTQRGNVVTDLLHQGLDVALSWLNLEKTKQTNSTERAKIDAEIAALQSGRKPAEIYGMQYLPWIIGGAAVLVVVVMMTKRRRR